MQNKKLTGRKKWVLPWYSVGSYLLLLLWSPTLGTALTLVSALLHEVGHYAVAKALRVEVRRVVLYPFGADMQLGCGLRSYGCEIAIAGAGAAMNLLLAGLGALLRIEELVASNLLLAGFNLLPVAGLDGGVILSALAGYLGGNGGRWLRRSSFLCLFGLWLCAVYLLFVADGDPSLFLLVCFLFATGFLRRDKRGG